MYLQLAFKNLLVATDGSEGSRYAYEQSLEFLEQKKEQFDQLIIAHITNRDKKYLPEKYQAETIFDDYKLECQEKFAHNKYRLVFEEKIPSQSSCREQILGLCERLQVTFLFLGSIGRKLRMDSDRLSQMVSHACLHSSVPLMITKKVVKRTPSEGFTFLVCVDGSNKSYKALNYTLNLAQNPNDRVIICYAPTPDKVKFTKTIKAKLQGFFELVSNVNFKFIELPQSYNPANQIVEFVNEKPAIESDQVHFIVIGNNGYRSQLEGKEFFGRAAEVIAVHSHVNVVVIT